MHTPHTPQPFLNSNIGNSSNKGVSVGGGGNESRGGERAVAEGYKGCVSTSVDHTADHMFLSVGQGGVLRVWDVRWAVWLCV